MAEKQFGAVTLLSSSDFISKPHLTLLPSTSLKDLFIWLAHLPDNLQNRGGIENNSEIICLSSVSLRLVETILMMGHKISFYHYP